jgi:hypothetical protein
MTLPDHCLDCGAPLAGSWTVHRPGCPFLQLIEDATGEAPKRNMIDLTQMRVTRELFAADLVFGLDVAAEAIAPPEPLYFPGVVVSAADPIRIRIHQTGVHLTLTASEGGRFLTEEGRPVRLFRLESIPVGGV